MQLCACSTAAVHSSDEGGGRGARSFCAQLRDGEEKLRQGSILEAEASLREALSQNNEEARALLGRLEYERGNYEEALKILEEIQASALGASLFYLISHSSSKKTGRKNANNNGAVDTYLHATSLLLEALYLKAKCLQLLGRLSEASQECKQALDTMETNAPTGLPADSWNNGKTKIMTETLSNIVNLHSSLLLDLNQTSEAMLSYRRTLLRFSFCLSSADLMHTMQTLAMLLLYSGVEAPPLTFGLPYVSQSLVYTPKNNTEEAILLLMLLLRIMKLEKNQHFDAEVVEHLAFALSTSGQLRTLAAQYEALLPGNLTRVDRWYSLAVCYAGGGESSMSLELVRKVLAQSEMPDDVNSLLLGGKLCAGEWSSASEGVEYCERAILQCEKRERSVGFRARGLHVLGVALRSQMVVASSDALNSRLRADALAALQEAASLDKGDPSILFDLSLELAEQRQLCVALDCAKYWFHRGCGGSRIDGWRLLALLLSALEKYAEADAVLASALGETSLLEQGPLLRTRAKLQLALDQPLLAVQHYRALLALMRAESKQCGKPKVEDVEVWHDLAQVYTQVQQWEDAETCLDKARTLNAYSAVTWFNTGLLREEQGRLEEAILCHKNALALDDAHVDSKVKLGALLWQVNGTSYIPASKSYLAKALESEPTHSEAWYNMGLLQKTEGRKREAAASFQAALLYEQSSPVEKFTSITPALLW